MENHEKMGSILLCIHIISSKKVNMNTNLENKLKADKYFYKFNPKNKCTLFQRHPVFLNVAKSGTNLL